MAPNPRRLAARLDALYAELPQIDCQRLCYDSCGPIPAAPFERQRMEREAGFELKVERHIYQRASGLESCHECSMMREQRCSVYAIRPMICRLWGLTEDMPCPYGCVPSRRLSVAEGMEFLRRAFEIAGTPDNWEQWTKEALEILLSDPKAQALMRNHHRPTLEGRRASTIPTVIEDARRVD